MKISSVNSVKTSFQGVWHLTSPKPNVYIDTYHPFIGEKVNTAGIYSIGRSGQHRDGYTYVKFDYGMPEDDYRVLTVGTFETRIGEPVDEKSFKPLENASGKDYPYVDVYMGYKGRVPGDITLSEKQYIAMVTDRRSPYFYNPHQAYIHK